MRALLAAASAASTARSGFQFPHLNFADTLSWSVPLLLALPIVVIALMALGVRTRISAFNLAVGGAVLTFVAWVVAAAASFQRATENPYDLAYQWLNLSLSFSGAAQFQTLTASVGVRLSHLSSVLIGGVVIAWLGVVIWSRAGARGETGPARYYGLLTLLALAGIGVVGSTDLAVLFVFWGLGGVATWLLLSHYWQDERSTRAARLALAVPMLGDLSLLAGIAILYSRYGQLSLDALVPSLHNTAGAGPRALALAASLVVVGACIRLACFPLQGWLTAQVGSPPAALAAVQTTWAVMALGLLFRFLPVIIAAGLWPARILLGVAVGTAVILPLIALGSRDVRRAAVAAGIGFQALAVIVLLRPQSIAMAVLLGTGIALARCAMTLGAANQVSGMRTSLLDEMGEGWQRMSTTTVAMLISAATLAGAVAAAASLGIRPGWSLAYAVALAIGIPAVARAYLLAGHGPLARRRGFDPNRVREVAGPMRTMPVALGLVGAALVASAWSTRWLFFLDARPHAHPLAWLAVLWIVVVIGLVGLALLLFFRDRPLGRRASNRAEILWLRVTEPATMIGWRFFVGPAAALVERSEVEGVVGGEQGMSVALQEASHVVEPRLSWLPTLLLIVSIVAVVILAITPGIHR